jgi:hypothetical protein
MAAAPRMLLLVDENVPTSVTAFLRSRNHDVRLVRDLFPRGVADPIIATLGDQMAALVVSWDRDFEALISRVPSGNRQRFRNLGRISFKCPEPKGVAMLGRWIEMIEFHYAQTLSSGGDFRMIVVISENGTRFL